MSKKSKASAKPSASEPSKVVINVEDEGWGDGATLSVRLQEPLQRPVAKGGYITQYGAALNNVFGAVFTTEENCCGFPLMCDFYEKPVALKHIKEIGEKVKEWLTANVVYMQAYVPSRKGYRATERILEAAGFEATVALTSKHGKYDNIRWEWNRSPNLSKRTNEKAVFSLDV